MKRMWLFWSIVTVIAVITIGFVAFADDADHANAEFLSGYGWIIDEDAIEKENINLPSFEDDVYRAYNRLQEEAGLSLSAYYGKSGVRYTYRVLNYPYPVNDTVRANVIVIDGKIVAGDIMTVASDGFMHSLVYPI